MSEPWREAFQWWWGDKIICSDPTKPFAAGWHAALSSPELMAVLEAGQNIQEYDTKDEDFPIVLNANRLRRDIRRFATALAAYKARMEKP